MKKKIKLICIFVSIFFGLAMYAQDIDNTNGVDSRVDYTSLTKYGPWDDRNYQIKLEDMEVLAENESELNIAIPAFFRIELRRSLPTIPKTGQGQYPRSAPEIFKELYGGFLRNGVITNQSEYTEADKLHMQTIVLPSTRATVNQEVKLNSLAGRAETAISHNPVNSNFIIAGANTDAPDQEMYFSSDGGATWTITPALSGNTCCDPTVAWSSDGTIAYTATLGNCGSGCAIWFYRSTDNGQTWGGRIDLTNSGSDKEYLHVDHSPSSPYKDNVYLTWHNSNVLQFARSTDLGLTFDSTISFSSSPSGIGSDITSDAAGNIYYIYPSHSSSNIILKKSTNGGDSFGVDQVISTTNGAFDYPIPAMDSRLVFIYTAAACDQSGGDYDGSIYACWNDTVDPETSSASNNHNRIVFAYSRDAGATWSTSVAHPTDDMDTVDRFNPWMDVDTAGNIHVIYYSTIRDPNRIKTDVYYTVSTDGGQTFETPTRVTAEQSDKITDSFEYGDYNGMSITLEQVLPIWTDNRPSDAPTRINAYTADVVNEFADPSFTIAVSSRNITTCAGSAPTVEINIGQIQTFSNPVTLSISGAPTGVTTSFDVNPVVPVGQSTLTLTVSGTTAPGSYELALQGSATGVDPKTLTLTLNVQVGAPDAPTLLTPSNGEPNAGFLMVGLDWSEVEGSTLYHIQVSNDVAFGSTIIDETVIESEFMALGLTQGNTYYWRVATSNTCQEGDFSIPFSFVAESELVLLVDQDSDSPDERPVFEDALNTLGVSYKVFDASSVHPTAIEMSAHPLVFWFSGDRTSGPKTPDLLEIETYINAGGKVFLSSEDFLYGLGGVPPVPTLVTAIFGIQDGSNDDGDYTSITGVGGSIFDGMGPFPLVYAGITDWSDIVTPSVDALLAFEGNNGNGAAIQNENTVFFAFPFSTITSSVKASNLAQQEVIQAIIEHLLGADPCSTSTLEVVASTSEGCFSDVQLDASVTGGVEAYSYSWVPASGLDNPTIANPMAGAGLPRTYSVTVTDGQGCTSQDSVQILSMTTAWYSLWTQSIMDLDTNGNGILDVIEFVSFLNTCNAP